MEGGDPYGKVWVYLDMLARVRLVLGFLTMARIGHGRKMM